MCSIVCIENHAFSPLFIKFSIQTCFLPDGIKVKSKQKYCLLISIFFHLKIESKLFLECTLFVEYSVFLILFYIYCQTAIWQYFFKASIFCCNSCCDKEKISKSFAKNNEFTSVLLRVGYLCSLYYLMLMISHLQTN